MANESILCPDCGGIVGATQVTDAGPPCTCFGNPKSDTIHGDPVAGTVAESHPTKVCALCGQDLSGKKRYKDSRGYICPKCSAQEEEAARGGRVRCADCGHYVKPETMTDYSGLKLCMRCHAQRQKINRQRIKHLGVEAAHRWDERRRILVLSAIAAVLLLVVLLHKAHLI